jgi:patatin-like phospholipase/acyl hydrolase
MQIGQTAYIDGAVVANNPTSLAIQEAAILFPNSDIDLIVSLGVGFNEKKATQENVSATMWAWGKATINVAIDAEKINREVKR